MARAVKMTVDYYPHRVSDSKTKRVLDSRYGNDGYACWFRLLELLCRTDGHAYACGNPVDWEYLVAVMCMDEGRLCEILDLLALMGKIDADLWHEDRVLWSAPLMAEIASVYGKRSVSVPEKPELRDNGGNPERKRGVSGVSGDGKRQSRVEYSREAHIEDDDQYACAPAREGETTERGDDEHGNPLPDPVYQRVENHYMTQLKKMAPVDRRAELLREFVGEMGADVACLAIQVTAEKAGDSPEPFNYLKRVLTRWSEAGVRDIAAAQREVEAFDARGRAWPAGWQEPAREAAALPVFD